LPIGEYTGSIAAKGFETLRIEPFVLEVGQTRTLNETMSIGTVLSQVAVQTAASGLDQSFAEIGGVIQRSQIQDIPLNGRNWAGLMSLSPGAIDSSNGVESGVRFAGLSQEDNNFLFDGVDATGLNHAFQQTALRLQISTEAIEEFRVNGQSTPQTRDSRPAVRWKSYHAVGRTCSTQRRSSFFSTASSMPGRSAPPVSPRFA
jgi:hypothetical protein